MHYFNGLQQKEITVYKKSDTKTGLKFPISRKFQVKIPFRKL